MKLSKQNIEDILWLGKVGFCRGASNFNELRQLGLVQRTRKWFGYWRWELTNVGKQEYNIYFTRYQCKSCIDLKERNLNPEDCKSCRGNGYIVY